MIFVFNLNIVLKCRKKYLLNKYPPMPVDHKDLNQVAPLVVEVVASEAEVALVVEEEDLEVPLDVVDT